MLYNQLNLDVGKIASKSEIKPEFACVYFTKQKTVATDSYRLLEVTVPEDCDAEDFPNALTELPEDIPGFLVPAKNLATIKLPKNKKLQILNNLAIRSITKNTVELLTNNLETANTTCINTVDGQYPDYEKIIPKDTPLAEVTVNANLLAELLEVMAKTNELHEVTIKLYGKNKPILLEASNDSQNARGVFMPKKS